MTVASRRLAARCRELAATDPALLAGVFGPEQPEPQADTAEVETTVPQENVEATAT